MTKLTRLLFALILILSSASSAEAQKLDPPPSPTPLSSTDTKNLSVGGASVISPSASERYGFFDALDHGSSYGQGVFPEPFLVDDSDLLTGEVEKGFGQLTLEIEASVEWDRTGDIRQGGNWDNIDLGARLPVYEYVGKKDFFDTTFGVAIEVGIPSSQSSRRTPRVCRRSSTARF